MKTRKILVLVVILAMFALLISACGGGSEADNAVSEAEARIAELEAELQDAADGAVSEEDVAALQAELEAAQQAAEDAAAAAAEELAMSMEDTGQVFILGAFRGTEETAFTSVIDAFEAKYPDIDVIYSGTAEFETLINIRVEAGDAPDIAAFPQPGAVAAMVEKDALTPLWDEALAIYDTNYQPAWKDLAAVDGTPYGMFHRVNAKGWVWYNKPAWEDAGWEVPTTWDELMALSQEMMDTTDIAPFCDGIESGAATGWKGTDWIENILLRTVPVEVHDQWVTGEVPFTDDRVKNAFEVLGDIWFTEGMTYGGPSFIASTNFQPPAQGMHKDPAECWMHMQGSFVTNFFTTEVQADLDNQVGVFMLPPIDDSLPFTLEVGGDQFVVFKGHERDEVKTFIEFLGTVESVEPWAKLGGSLFPHLGQDFTWYPTELEQTMAEAITTAEAARFDGSDNMSEARNKAFWAGITDWVSGASTLDEALAEIEEASQ
ncbi:MAG TPA: ABC transporter substrate-binding protein [Anaerolineales bacterium]|nr:ABC transporter substrate-binding protein [Anaerolineales bacterium]